MLHELIQKERDWKISRNKNSPHLNKRNHETTIVLSFNRVKITQKIEHPVLYLNYLNNYQLTNKTGHSQ
jgi:hypothetical protein